MGGGGQKSDVADMSTNPSLHTNFTKGLDITYITCIIDITITTNIKGISYV